MLYPTLITLHLLAAVVWVGGMFFAHMVLRPASQALEPRDRLMLFSKVFPRFFLWVWICILTLFVTGYWVLFSLYGGFATAAVYVHVMQLLGIIMAVLFVWMYLVPFRNFAKAVADNDMSAAGGHIGAIRAIITINLVLGLVTTVIGGAGAYWG